MRGKPRMGVSGAGRIKCTGWAAGPGGGGGSAAGGKFWPVWPTRPSQRSATVHDTQPGPVSIRCAQSFLHKARGVDPDEMSLGFQSDVICEAGLVLFLFPVENSRAQHSPLLPPPRAFTAVAQDQDTVPPQTSPSGSKDPGRTSTCEALCW